MQIDGLLFPTKPLSVFWRLRVLGAEMRKITERPGGSMMLVEVVSASVLMVDSDDAEVIWSVRVPAVESNDTVSEPD